MPPLPPIVVAPKNAQTRVRVALHPGSGRGMRKRIYRNMILTRYSLMAGLSAQCKETTESRKRVLCALMRVLVSGERAAGLLYQYNGQ